MYGEDEMDGKRIQMYMDREAKSMLEVYQQFQELLPSAEQNAAAHKGEDGRYVESLIRNYLRKFLPVGLEVLTGFILRPAVKTGVNNRSRRREQDQHSTQLDIIVYDSSHYPIFQRFDRDNVIVPPEGVIAIISVKKKFNEKDFYKEALALKKASQLCHCVNENKERIRGPYLGMVAMDSVKKTGEKIFTEIKKAYADGDSFDDAVGLIANLGKWSIFKRRPSEVKTSLNIKTVNAEYIYFAHGSDEEHFGLQFLLTGILSVYYDQSRSIRERPGFTAFPSKRSFNKRLGTIEFAALR